MKVYDSFGPNPRALRMFLHEKGQPTGAMPGALLRGPHPAPTR